MRRQAKGERPVSAKISPSVDSGSTLRGIWHSGDLVCLVQVVPAAAAVEVEVETEPEPAPEPELERPPEVVP